MILILLSVVLALASLLAVAYPILARSRTRAPLTTSAEETVEELLAGRDAAFQALRELGFDHEVGKITDEDFVVFAANLRQTAADSLRAVDEWEAQADSALELVLEGEVAARAAVLSEGGRPCPNCGHLAAPEDRFCASCGAPLPATPEVAAVITCPNCGQPAESSDRFCAACGHALPAVEGERLGKDSAT